MIQYENLINERVQKVKPSGIRKFFDIAATMDDVLSLSIGEPDFITPWNVREAGIDSLVNGHTYYTSNAGMLELRRGICEYYDRNFGVHYPDENHALVTVGGSEAIDLCIRSLIGPGDEVIIPEPSFVCYAPLTEIVGGVPVGIATKAENEFRLTAEELRAAITPKTKLLILPYPGNPTGAVMEKKDLEAIAEVLRDTDIMVLSDELYAKLTYGSTHVSIASIEGMWERTVVVNGFSKAFAMTGWRIGYALGPVPIIKAMTKLHQFAIMCAPTMAQEAALAALSEKTDEAVQEMVEEYDARRRMLLDRFKKMGLPCFEPKGAFYIFPCIKQFGMTSEEFCEKFLYEEHVAVVPGSAFGVSGEGFVRISYAKSMADLSKAMDRLERFLSKL